MAQQIGRRRRRRKKKNRIRVFRSLVLAIALLVVVGVCGYGVKNLIVNNSTSIYERSDEKILKYIEKQNKKECVMPNIYVDGVAIGGLTKKDAQDKLNKSIKLPDSDTAVIVADNNGKYTKEYKMDDFGILFDVDGAFQKAYAFARTGDDAQMVADFKSLENNSQDFQVMFFDESKIRTVVDGIASGINVQPVDASVKKGSNGFEITPSVIGYSMDADTLYAKILDAVNNRDFGSTINFDITQTNPKYTEDDFQYISNEIGSCYSKYKGGDENRITNLKNGCAKIDGVVLYPDEVFSTNDHFNPCTYENGWRDAGTIVGGKVEDSIGGGMCQVSSALYQAVLEAELDIVERFNHSLKVGYADYAFDATLAGDYKDLKFKNNTGYPLYIEGYCTSSNVVVKIYGYEIHDAGRKIEFKNKFIKSTEPDEPLITNDDTKPEGYEEYTQTALEGQTYELYKYVYENGVLTDTVKINTSTYSPRRAEITRGTKKPETVTEQQSDTSDTAQNNSGNTSGENVASEQIASE
jgi:vancomycin resistance protein YoaR